MCKFSLFVQKNQFRNISLGWKLIKIHSILKLREKRIKRTALKDLMQKFIWLKILEQLNVLVTQRTLW